MSDWISVDDELPEDEVNVLCLDDGPRARHFNARLCRKSGWLRNWDSGGSIREYVTHWQQIPAKPGYP